MIIERDDRQWYWPDDDTKLIQVFDQVNDIDLIMQYVENRSVCIQAGGACGVWPRRFSELFSQVITFEPVAENYQCLKENIKDTSNIVTFNLALSNAKGSGGMLLHESEKGNAGAWYLSKSGTGTHTIAIDDLHLLECGLIQLDVEGAEREVIEGAAHTIKACKPTIVIEEKKLPQQPGSHLEARELLQSMGYKQAATIHRDVVFVPC